MTACRNLPAWNVLTNIPPLLTADVTGFHVFGQDGRDLIFTVGERFANGTTTPSQVFIKKQNVDSTCVELPPLRGKSVVNIVSNKVGTIFILTTDKLFGLGTGGCGQVGGGGTHDVQANGIVTVSSALSKPDIAVQVSCGRYHCACVTNTGQLFTWGGYKMDGRYKRLGHKGSGLWPERAKITAPGDHKFVQVACSSEATFALNSEGSVYSFDFEGFLNFEGNAIVDISAGFHHMLALSCHGTVFAWGKNDKKQLGYFSDVDYVDDPKEVASFDGQRIASVLAFQNTSFAFSYADAAFVWGKTRFTTNEPGKNNESKFWQMPSTCLTPVPTPSPQLNGEHSFVDVLQNELGGPLVTPRLIRVTKRSDTTDAKVDALSRCFDDPTTADFRVIIDGKTIYVHKAVLMNRSTHFRAMLAPPIPTDGGSGSNKLVLKTWLEANMSELTISDISYHVYRAYLMYLYQGHIPECLAVEETFDLAELAQLYLDDQLKTQAYESALAKFLTKDQVFNLYAASVRNKAELITNKCKAFILNNFAAALKSTSIDNFPAGFADAKDILSLFKQALLAGAIKA